MCDIEQMEQFFKKYLECSVQLRKPQNSSNPWFLDLELRGHPVTVEWRPAAGFGIVAGEDVHFGEGVHEIYTDYDSALRRIMSLLVFGSPTIAPGATLKELRQKKGISQVDLAERLKNKQGGISRVEARGESIRVDTLRKVVKALGGELSIRVRMPNGEETELQLRRA